MWPGLGGGNEARPGRCVGCWRGRGGVWAAGGAGVGAGVRLSPLGPWLGGGFLDGRMGEDEVRGILGIVICLLTLGGKMR